jgi:hypothetical protein
MPLPDSPNRVELHHRRIEMRGYRRADGLYEIDGRVTDVKTERTRRIDGGREFEPGTPIHDMWVRLVVDETLLVHDIVAVTDASPYEICREAVEPMRAIVGERIKGGWSTMVKAKLGGAQGCTHLMEILIPLATAAYQTLTSLRLSQPPAVDADGRPRKIDSCYAYGRNRAVVQKLWPKFHDPTPAAARTPRRGSR